jgi:hypothetical protein
MDVDSSRIAGIRKKINNSKDPAACCRDASNSNIATSGTVAAAKTHKL